jgi:hypothetical protein
LHRRGAVRLELLPVIFGILVGLAGLGLIADGYFPDSAPRVAERRRRARAERNRMGEIAIGAGLMALAAALVGRDAWRYGTLAVLAGVALVAVGVGMNGSYLRETLTFRGAARRGRGADRPLDGPTERPADRVADRAADRPPPAAGT